MTAVTREKHRFLLGWSDLLWSVLNVVYIWEILNYIQTQNSIFAEPENLYVMEQ